MKQLATSQCENYEKITGGRKIWAAPRGVGSGVPNSSGVWGGGCALSPENFLTFWIKIVHFGIYSDKKASSA